MDILYSKDLTNEAKMILSDYQKFEIEDDVLFFKKLDRGLCNAIVEDMGIGLTIITNCPKSFVAKVKVLKPGYYSVGKAIVELIRNDIGDFKIDVPETLEYTIDEFLKNNLSVNKTAQNLYLHRNSLDYRIKRFKDLTGLNIKNFEDAFAYQLYKNFVKKR